MEKVHAEGYGDIRVDLMDLDSNEIILYCVCICDDDGKVVDEEHYVKESDYETAVHKVYGRELRDEQWLDGNIVLVDKYGAPSHYELPCLYRMAYVVDHNEN